MNIQDYISSGIIEAYVLGLTTEQETHELEMLCRQYPEIQDAIDSYQQTMEEYARLHAVAPAPGLKEKIWQKLESESLDTAKQITAHIQAEPPAIKVSGGSWMKYLVAASLILLAGSVAFNIILSGRFNKYESEIDKLSVAQNELQLQNETYRKELDQYQQDAHLMMDPAVKRIALSGVPAHPDMKVTILWHTQSKDVYLSFNNLPAPPPGKQYQLWAIVDGKPVDAGVYSGSSMSAQKMKAIEKAEMFAITLEQEGGSPIPTMEQMYAAGKII